MFPPNLSVFALVVLFIPTILTVANKTQNRRSRDFRQFDVSSNNFRQPSANSRLPARVQSANYFESPPGSASASASTSEDGYIPGPPPPQLQNQYLQAGSFGPPPGSGGLLEQTLENGYNRPISPQYPSSSLYQSPYSPGQPPPSFSSSYNSGYRPGAQSQFENNYPSNSEPPTYPSGSLGYNPQLSPYGQQHQSYSPAGIYPNSQGYFPARPTSHLSFGQYPSHPGHFVSSGASASASASSGHGSAAAAAAASASSPNHGFSWGPPPSFPPSPSGSPPPSGLPPSGPPPSEGPETESVFGWRPFPQNPPYKPVPEFSYQFSLKPSSFGWETSYNVPCGNYKIQPRVVANLRLATQAVLPRNSGGQQDYHVGDSKRRRKRNQSIPSARSFLDPFRLERTLQSYNPYQPQQFTQPQPTFRPRTCRWNFNAEDGCKLNFKCDFFQLPALFRCDENKLYLTDSTIHLDTVFCGNRRPRMNQIFSSNSGRLSLTFKSKGAALPAILDCTVLCTPEELNSELLSPAATEVSTDAPSPSPSLPGEQPTLLPSFPIIAHQHALVSSASTNKEQQQIKNSTLITKRPPSKPQMRMGNCKCGVPDSHFSSKVVHGRIVGGSSMMPGESPWTAALVKRNSNRPYCGASLINNRFLLTAAHCVFNQARTRGYQSGTHATGSQRDVTEQQIYFDVLLNEHDISQPNEIAGGTIRAKVDKVIVHPNYDNVTFSFDAALIRLADPIEFNSWTERKIPLAQIYHMNSNNRSNVTASVTSDTTSNHSSLREKSSSSNAHRLFHNIFDFHSLKRRKRFLIPEIEARAIPPKPVPICLPDKESSSAAAGRYGRNTKGDEDNYAVVTGWGLVTEGGTPSTEMLKARVEIFNDTTCQELYKKHNYVITDSMMCAGFINGKIDSCVGDSGSPLATEDNDRFVLTGVVSWGRGCGRKQLPGVYTRVAELTDWIYSEASTKDAVWCE